MLRTRAAPKALRASFDCLIDLSHKGHFLSVGQICVQLTKQFGNDFVSTFGCCIEGSPGLRLGQVRAKVGASLVKICPLAVSVSSRMVRSLDDTCIGSIMLPK